MPRPPRPPRVRTGRHPRRPVRWRTVIGFLEAHVDVIDLDKTELVEYVRRCGNAEAQRIIEARLAARAAADDAGFDSNRDSNPGGQGRSEVDAEPPI